MAILCPGCKRRKLVLLGTHLRGIAVSKEFVDYWCEGCQVVHSYAPKDWVQHGLKEENEDGNDDK